MRIFAKRRPLSACLAVAALIALPLHPAIAQETEAPESGETERETAAADADPALDPEAFSIANQIVTLGYPEENREALFFGTMDQTVTQMRGAIAPSLPRNDPEAIAILDKWIAEYTQESKLLLRKHIPAIMTGMTQAYATIFTLEELNDILAFVSTPSGQRYFELSPAVMGAKGFADANQRYLDESMEMLTPAQNKLQARLQEHFADKEQSSAAPDT